MISKVIKVKKSEKLSVKQLLENYKFKCGEEKDVIVCYKTLNEIENYKVLIVAE